MFGVFHLVTFQLHAICPKREFRDAHRVDCLHPKTSGASNPLSGWWDDVQLKFEAACYLLAEKLV